jgi:hypothetical protein
VTLSAQEVATIAEASARRTVELLTEMRRAPMPGELVDVKAKAKQLGVSEDHVRRHAKKLQGVNAGSGSRPLWRFPAEPPAPGVQAPPAAATPRRTARTARQAPRTAPLLPVRERAAR